MRKTLEDIRREGLEALRERLGPAGMVRFLQQFESGQGDFASERRDWVDRTSLDDLQKRAKGASRTKSRGRNGRRK